MKNQLAETVSYILEERRIDHAILLISCCKIGSYITEGRSHVERVELHYNADLKALAEHLQNATEKVSALSTCALATLHMGGKEFSTDTSIWPKIGLVLNEFVTINEMAEKLVQTNTIENPKDLDD